MTKNFNIDVIVVGAGPTGLLAASELAAQGISVVLLDKRTEPDSTIKAGSINVATAEIFDRRGLRSAARRAHRDYAASMAHFRETVSAGTSWRDQAARHTDAAITGPSFPVTGHFAGMLFQPDLVDQSDPELAAHHSVDGSTLVKQSAVEQILTERAIAVGVEIRRGVDVTGFDAVLDPDSGEQIGIEARTSHGTVTASWLVGTDGGRSTIRKQAGIGFIGSDAETTGYQAIADMEGTQELKPGWAWTPTGVYSFGPIPGRILTVQFAGAPADRSAPVTAEELQASIRLVTGTEVTVKKIHGTATRWTDNARQAKVYRAGRVLLAGDAAHVHSPFSGQGLNLGAGDAINLGWKLAATIQGWAPEGLLDTYQAERHPIGAWVLDWTRAQVALMRGDTKTGHLRDVVARNLLGTQQGMTAMVKLASGIGQTYNAAGTPGGTVTDQNTVVGRLIGDVSLSGGHRLADHFHDGRFILLDRTKEAIYVTNTAGWHHRVRTVTDRDNSDTDGQYGLLQGLLVRPDGVIIWTSEDDMDSVGLFTALTHWAGAAIAVGAPASTVRA
jgi:2-polyprenyl-6-methoxyphenol hydroxylase-like FAD-dependent oxidoreductase